MRRIVFAFTSVALLAVLVIAGCNKSSDPTSPKAAAKKAAPIDPWILKTIDPDDPTPALVWNGLVGFRIGRDGGAKGQPFFSIDEFDTTGEEKIRSMESPLPNGFLVDGKPLPITGEYRQSIDMRTSELTTHWRSGDYTVDCVTVLHPKKKIIAERWTLTGLTQEHLMDFDAGSNGKLGNETMLSSDISVGPSKMTGKFIATRIQTPNPTVNVVITLGKSPNWEAMLAARALDHKAQLPQGWDRAPTLEDFPTVENETKVVWADRWKTDIEIDGPVEDQQAVRSFLFYLRSGIHPDGGMSISPFGLSNTMYNGHVFWDADIWVFPALALIDPIAAKAIVDYRYATLNLAYRNVEPSNVTAGVIMLDDGTSIGTRPTKFAWESSVSGKETIFGPSQKELHISGDVAWSMNQAAELGLESESSATNVMSSIVKYLWAKSTRNPANKDFEIRDVMSPDENHTGDNDLYSNLLAQWISNGGTWWPLGTARGPRQYKLPHDEKSFLTYDGDPVKSYKQAAAVLSIYPLQYPPAEKQARVMMERFADKVIKNGPAMSDSVHALIWARLGENERAYKTWRDSWEPFTNQPFMLFSEKRSKPTTYFTTGAGGSLQTVLFGFIGFRLDSVQEQGAAWSKKLLGNNWLSIKANLPKEWKSVKVKDFTVLGHKYTLTATHRPTGPDAVQVIQGD